MGRLTLGDRAEIILILQYLWCPSDKRWSAIFLLSLRSFVGFPVGMAAGAITGVKDYTGGIEVVERGLQPLARRNRLRILGVRRNEGFFKRRLVHVKKFPAWLSFHFASRVYDWPARLDVDHSRGCPFLPCH